MVKKSNRKRRYSRSRKRRKRRRRRRRRTRRRRRRKQRGGVKYINAIPRGRAFEPGKNNGLGNGHYYLLNQNPSALDRPRLTSGKMLKRGGRRRTRNKKRRTRKQRGGSVATDVRSMGRKITLAFKNPLHGFLGEEQEIGDNVAKQPYLDTSFPKYRFL